MKYKLTKAAIEELKAMEFHTPRSMFVMEGMGDMRRILAGEWIFEEIKPKLPKPVLKSVEDLKALEGWEYGLRDWANSDYRECNEWRKDFDFMKFGRAKIRQIDMPENEYLVKDCIEQEIEVGDLFIFSPNGKGIYLIAKSISYAIVYATNDVGYIKASCKLIRKAADITPEDREKYLGEKHDNDELEAKVREIIKKVLKEEAGE